GVMATHRATQLTARHPNASRITQPYSPSSYSLMNRHVGSRSGRSTCNTDSSAINAAEATNASLAATRDRKARGSSSPAASGTLFPDISDLESVDLTRAGNSRSPVDPYPQ